jgi:curved DNA-binding protein CbpA
MISSYYYEVLGIKEGASLKEIKKAYHQLVRQNHPDLFPEEKKELQELKMIEINEAYARITEKLKFQPQKDQNEDQKEDQKEYQNWKNKDEGKLFKTQGSTEQYIIDKKIPGPHRDIQYVYYKQGFEHFSQAVSGIKSIERRATLKNDLYYLRRFSASLYYLRKADMYFSKLVEVYPESIWSADASIKIRKIEYFNRLYRKILLNIEQKLKEKYRGLSKNQFSVR